MSTFLLQLTGDLTQANDKVSMMQQNCVDDILNTDYAALDDTEAVINETRKTIEDDLLPYICQPFDCNGNGKCVNGTCVCDSGVYVTFQLMHRNTIRYANTQLLFGNI